MEKRLYYFDKEVATKYGLAEAVFLHYLALHLNSNHKKNITYVFREGYVWTYCSAKRIANILTFFTPKQVDYLVDKLRGKGLIRVDCFSDDFNTRWFTIVDEWLIRVLLNFRQPFATGVAVDEDEDPFFASLQEDDCTQYDPKSGKHSLEMGCASLVLGKDAPELGSICIEECVEACAEVSREA